MTRLSPIYPRPRAGRPAAGQARGHVRLRAAGGLLAVLATVGVWAAPFTRAQTPPATEGVAAPTQPTAVAAAENATVHAQPRPLAPGARTADSASFLGPDHNLVIPESPLVKSWPADGPPLVWEMKKGSGYASPAVVGDRLVLWHRIGNQETLDCLRATDGHRFWRYQSATRYRDRYGYSDGPRASPVVGGDAGHEAAFVLAPEGMLRALELADGHLRWERDLTRDFKIKPGFFGCGSTPLVEGGKLIVNVGAEPKGPTVVAFDLLTGKQMWTAGTAWGMSYASPVPAVLHGKRRVLVFAGGETREGDDVTGGLLCLDPETGKIDFTFPWRGDRRESVNASTPLVVGDDRIFISECYGSGGAMLQVTPDLQPRTLWTNAGFGTHFMTALADGEYLYGVDGHGPNDAFLVCVSAATGKEQWRTQPEWVETIGQREMTMGTYRAHLMRADGQTWMLGEFGHLLRVELSPQKVTVLQRARLFLASETWTPPVLSHGLLYVCQNTPANGEERSSPRILCYDVRGP